MATHPKHTRPQPTAPPAPPSKGKRLRLSEEDRQDIRDARRELARVEREGVISWDSLKEEIDAQS